jgi:ubiquinone biosynthesis protein Coq4
MRVTEYLQRARECADIAERVTGKDKDKLKEIATAWLQLADEAAKAAGHADRTKVRTSAGK